MKFFFAFCSILILLISNSLVISVEIDLSFSKSEPVELEDLCLKRPYHKTDEPWYWIPMFRAKMKTVGEKYSFSSRCFAKNIVSFKEMSKDKIIVINVSGRGDKDVAAIARYRGVNIND